MYVPDQVQFLDPILNWLFNFIPTFQELPEEVRSELLRAKFVRHAKVKSCVYIAIGFASLFFVGTVVVNLMPGTGAVVSCAIVALQPFVVLGGIRCYVRIIARRSFVVVEQCLCLNCEYRLDQCLENGAMYCPECGALIPMAIRNYCLQLRVRKSG